jgi:putative salt-induced outer membrane protein YdiY
MSGVTGLVTEEAKGVALDDEEPRVEQLVVEGDQQLLLNADGSKESISTSTVLLIWPADEKMPAPTRLWTGRLELGLTGTDGNSDRFTFVGRSEGVRDAEATRLRLFALGFYAEDEGVRSQNEFKGGGRYEWKFSDLWSAYTSAELEHDEFEALDLRSTIVFGIGYQALKSPRQMLMTRLGLGYQYETFDVAEDKDEAILDLGYEYELKIKKWAKLRQDTTYHSALENPVRGYRIIANSSAEIPLASNDAWKLRLGVKHEYDDAPLPGIDRLDTTYFLNLAYDW